MYLEYVYVSCYVPTERKHRCLICFRSKERTFCHVYIVLKYCFFLGIAWVHVCLFNFQLGSESVKMLVYILLQEVNSFLYLSIKGHLLKLSEMIFY